MWTKLFIQFYVFVLFAECINDKKKDTNSEIFVPTNEWKEIRDGQRVPSGLYYRINLSTGKKEAKLIENKQADPKNSFLLVENKLTEENDKGILKVKNNEYTSQKKEDSYEMKRRFRSYEELKEDLGALNLMPKSDAELLHELFLEYEQEMKKSEPEKKIILAVLKDLIFLSHQYDNAIEFVRLDGFNKIIYKNLNSSMVEIKQEALKLLSSLVQNNSKVKIHALETGAVSTLLKILSLGTSPKIKHSALTALSCLLRTFPFAQKNFIEMGGLNVFSEILKSNPVRLKLKLITLIDDLLVERKNDKENFINHKSFNIENMLFKLNWCQHLNKVLIEVVLIDLEDHDSIEKSLVAMESMNIKCNQAYEKEIISHLYNRYKALAKLDVDDQAYFQELSGLCDKLLGNSTNSQHNLKIEF